MIQQWLSSSHRHFCCEEQHTGKKVIDILLIKIIYKTQILPNPFVHKSIVEYNEEKQLEKNATVPHHHHQNHHPVYCLLVVCVATIMRVDRNLQSLPAIHTVQTLYPLIPCFSQSPYH